MTNRDLNDNCCALFIDYFYSVKILVKHNLNIQKRYLYVVAILISLILAINIGNANATTTLKGVLRYVVLFLTNYFIWILLLDYIYGAIIQLQRIKENLIKRIFEFVISFLLLIIFQLIITNIIYYAYLVSVGSVAFSEIWSDFKPFLFSSILSRLIDLVIIALIIKAIEAYLTIQKQRLQVISLKNELNVSQLNALRSQLDPHFLFNALHTLNTLIGYEDDKAKSMVLKITNLMRKMLNRREEHLITLAEELDYFNNYLEIEQERFHDRLDVTVDISHETLPFKVPALILQPLIENAFKHGISRIGGKGEINLKAFLEENNLKLIMTNTIPLKEKGSLPYSTKLGLENLKNRLKLFFDDQHRFSAEKKDGLFVVKLKLAKKSNI